MQFAATSWLLALCLIPLLWAAIKAADRRAERRAGLLLGPQAARLREAWHPRLRGWRRFWYLTALVWLVLALARPQWGASEVSVTQRGHDVVIALDVSRSMLAQDVAPSRLERAKAELTSFMRRQTDSRIGLVLFAGAAFVQCPLTTDLATAEVFLQMASPDMISAQGTALAPALRLSRELLLSGRRIDEADGFQAILLVTDGEDFEGGWEQEAQICRREGITVIPVGIGEESGGLIPVTDDHGRPAGFLRDAEGGLVMTRLDLASLERLATIGGGSAFRVGLDGLAGERLRTVLERLGKREFEQRRVTRYQERYVWPLILALTQLGLAVAIRPRRAAPDGRMVDPDTSQISVSRSGSASRVASGRPAPARRSFIGPLTAILIILAALHPDVAVSAAGHDRIMRPDWAAVAERGRAAYAEGDYATALHSFELARAREPNDPRLALAVGAALYQLGQHEQAAHEFARARQLSGRRDIQAESLFNAGTVALARGDAETAIDYLRRSLRLEPERSDALHNLEAALLQLQEMQQRQDQDCAAPEDSQAEGDSQDQQRDDGAADAEDRENDEPRDPGGESSDHETNDREPSSQDEPDLQQDGAQDLDREQALRLLQALDRDEQELQRSVQQRLRGPGAQSGREW